MQTTLLGLAIAIIVALIAALVGPLLVDWGAYRSTFEAEAGRLVGVDMRVNGAIDVRLLPSPRLILRDVEIGKGTEQVGARSLGIELALGPLMRGEWHATRLQVSGLTLRMGLDASGRLAMPHIPVDVRKQALAIDRLSIEDSRLTLFDEASGGTLTLDKVRFTGEVRSLLGPFGGDGEATVAGARYPFRVTAGRATDEGAIKVHLNVAPVDHPMTMDADGMLSFAGDEPKFDGTLALARPLGIASQQASSLSQPWRLSGKIQLSSASALMPQFSFQYGAEKQNAKLTGSAEFKFGKHPRFDGVLSGRQIDLGQALAQQGAALPLVALRDLAGFVVTGFHPHFPVQIGIGIDRIALGSGTVDDLRGDISSSARGWTLDRFEFRAPGFTRVRLSGALTAADHDSSFSGPAEIETSDAKALLAWAKGEPPPDKQVLQPLHLRGDAILSKETLTVERLSGEFDGKAVSGRLTYSFAPSDASRLAVDIAAPELDLDAARGFAEALFAGLHAERPHHVSLKADIDRARLAGVEMRQVGIAMTLDGTAWQLSRFSASDVAGNALALSGRVETGGKSPHQSLTFDLDARQPSALIALAGKFGVHAGNRLADVLARSTSGKMHGTADIAGEGAAAAATLKFAGNLGDMRLNTTAQFHGGLEDLSKAAAHIDSHVDLADSNGLFKLAGLDRLFGAHHAPSHLTLQLAGSLGGDIKGSAHLAGDNLDATSSVALHGMGIALDGIKARFGQSTFHGDVQLAEQAPPKLEGALAVDSVKATDLLAALCGAGLVDTGGNWSKASLVDSGFGDVTGDVALKVARLDFGARLAVHQFQARLRFAQGAVSVDDIAGTIAGGKVSGQTSFVSSDRGVTAHVKLALIGGKAAGLLPAATPAPLTGIIDLDADVEGAGLSVDALIGSLHGSGALTVSKGSIAALDPQVFASAARAIDTGLPADPARVSAFVDTALGKGSFPLTRAHGAIAVNGGLARLAMMHVDDPKGAALSLGGSLDLTSGAIDGRLVLSGPLQGAGGRPDIYVTLSGPLAAPTRAVDTSSLVGWLTLRAVENQAKRLKEAERAAQSAPANPVVKTNEPPSLPPPLDIRPVPMPRAAPSVGAHH